MTVQLEREFRVARNGRAFRDRRSTICRLLEAQSLADIPEYKIWIGMRQRCKSRDNYTRRGIKVCERWESFEAFLADMGSRPSSKHSIERKDNDEDYGPENCIWADIVTQANNRSNNRLVFYRGSGMSLMQAIRAAGSVVRKDTAWHRIAHGWAVEDAVETPPEPKYQNNRHAPTIQTIESGMCRYPLGEPTHDMPMCGAPCEELRPYCSEHSRICFTLQSKREAR